MKEYYVLICTTKTYLLFTLCDKDDLLDPSLLASPDSVCTDFDLDLDLDLVFDLERDRLYIEKKDLKSTVTITDKKC